MFEKRSTLRGEIPDSVDIIGRVGTGNAEIGSRAGLIEGQSLQAIADSQILFCRERLRIEHFNPDLAVGQPGILIQQLTDTVGVAGDIRPDLVKLLRSNRIGDR
jgi:hypothetical protein